MKKKWIVLAGAVVALGALVATAAAHKGGKMRAVHGVRGLVPALDLSGEQEVQLRDLRSSHRDQVKAARGQEREARKVLQEGHTAAVEKILNEQQREQFAKMRGHRGHGKRGWGGRGHGSRDPFAQLDLSDAQKAQLTDLRSAQREEMGKLRQVHREAVEKVLTASQREKLAVLKDEAFYGGKHRYRMR